MLKPQIAILDYGSGNIQSIKNALNYVECNPIFTNNKELINCSQGLIIPGVGAFSNAMDKLRKNNLVEHLSYYAKILKKPVLGICLGMQLLFENSHEFGNHEGLGFLRGSVEKIDLKLNTEKKLPHISWAELCFNQDNILFKNIPIGSDVYFVHSYICEPVFKRDIIATSNFGNTLFCSAVKKNNILGFQFHPEKSGEVGLKLLKNFIKLC